MVILGCWVGFAHTPYELDKGSSILRDTVVRPHSVQEVLHFQEGLLRLLLLREQRIRQQLWDNVYT